jgi:hypothetical protein
MVTEEARTLFWDAIKGSNRHARSHWSKYDPDAHVEALVKRLSKRKRDDLIAFQAVLLETLHALRTVEIAELCTVLENLVTKHGDQYVFGEQLSTDGFIYFRCWLVLKGRAFVQDMLEDISNFVSGRYSFNIAQTWAESLLYAAEEAYGARHDNPEESEIADAVAELHPDLPHYDFTQVVWSREPSSGAALQARYPKLVAEIGALRSG